MIESADKYKDLVLKIPNNNMYATYEYQLEFVRKRFVSTYNGAVIGKIEITINTKSCSVFSMSIISLTEQYRISFAKDVMTFTRSLMRQFRKINFMVLIGNPAEKTYDRLAKTLGWRIIGTMEKEVLNLKGEWNDAKYYEYINPYWRPENGS